MTSVLFYYNLFVSQVPTYKQLRHDLKSISLSRDIFDKYGYQHLWKYDDTDLTFMYNDYFMKAVFVIFISKPKMAQNDLKC